MDEAHINVALTTSKHNVQYLLGSHRTFFFDHMDAMGPSRYLPVLAYPKGAPEQGAYVGHGTESFQHALSPLWTPQVYTGPADSNPRRGFIKLEDTVAVTETGHEVYGDRAR